MHRLGWRRARGGRGGPARAYSAANAGDTVIGAQEDDTLSRTEVDGNWVCADVESNFEYGRPVTFGSDALVLGDVAVKIDGHSGVLRQRVTEQQAEELLRRHVEMLQRVLDASSPKHGGRMRERLGMERAAEGGEATSASLLLDGTDDLRTLWSRRGHSPAKAQTVEEGCCGRVR